MNKAHLLILITFQILVLPLLAVDIRINCGEISHSEFHDMHWQPDLAYTPGGYGFIGGRAYTPETIFWTGGTELTGLYTTARKGHSEYRFDVPNGQYIVRLFFAEKSHHGINMRIMDVQIEDSIALSDFDISTYREKDYAVTKVFLVEVIDGTLNITFDSSIGETLLNAIWVSSADPSTIPPETPEWINAWSSYNGTIVHWEENYSDNSLAGYIVYRDEWVSWVRLTEEPTTLNAYLDFDATIGSYYRYRVKAVDVYGNESDFSSPSEYAIVLEKGSTDLPVYELFIHESDIAFLDRDPYARTYIRGTFVHEGRSWEHVRIRYRGGYSRHFSKKGWKINFRSDNPFFGLNVINLNGEYKDAFLFKNLYGTNLFGLAGIDSPEASYANLWVNDEFYGVMLQLEQIDERYLRNRHYDENDYIYKNVLSNYSVLSDDRFSWSLHTGSGASDDFQYLSDFIDIINYTPDYKIEETFDSLLNVEYVLRYFAVISLIDDIDYTYHNHNLHRVAETGKWHIIPWDLNLGFQHSERPLISTFYEPDGVIFGPNLFFTRVLSVENYRSRYIALIDSLSETLFSEEQVHNYIDSLRSYVRLDAWADYRKFLWEHNDTWEYLSWVFPYLVRARVEFVQTQLDTFLAFNNPTGIFLNELCINNFVYPDDYGEYDPFLELYNAGDESFNIGNLYLTDEPFWQRKWRLPYYELHPGEYAIIWLDGQPWQGDFHAPFTADSTGGFLGLFDGRFDDPVKIPARDLLFYGEFNDSRSWQRYPDGERNWLFSDPTPNGSNTDSVEEPIKPLALGFYAYPNPFNSACRIIASEGSIVNIFDTRGNKVATLSGGEQIWTPEANLPSGVYNIVVSDNYGNLSAKRIVYLK